MDDEYGYNGESHDYNNSQYLRARYYDTSSGTFPQQDSYLGEIESPITQNRYSYVHNNPITGDDPSGHMMLSPSGDHDVEEITNIYGLSRNSSNEYDWMSSLEAEAYYLSTVTENTRNNFYNKQGVGTETAEDIARRAYAENYKREQQEARIKRTVDEWEGDSGYAARKYFYGLLDKGNMTYEQAFQYALDIKKICDRLDAEQLSMVKEEIRDMSFSEVNRFFEWRSVTTQGTHNNGNVGEAYVTIFSEFTNFLNTNRTLMQNVQSLAIGAGVIVSIATAVGIAGLALYGVALLASAIASDYVLFTELMSMMSYGSVSIMDGNGNGKPDALEVMDGNGDGTPDTFEVMDINGNGIPDILEVDGSLLPPTFYAGPDGTIFGSLAEAEAYYIEIYGPDWQEHFTTTVKPNQVHHFISDKNSTYTPEMKKILDKYDLDINGDWNKQLLPHQGRHPNAYHEWVIRELENIDSIAKGDQQKFLQLFEQNIKNKVINEPNILYSDYWKNTGK